MIDWPNEIAQIFPNTRGTNADKTSEATTDYNCIAHAAGEDDRWWSPTVNYYWPKSASYDMKPSSLIEAYQAVGYEICEDDNREEGFTKIALYKSSIDEWTHAAVQKGNGEWSSKLGGEIDIRHDKPEHLNGVQYGTVYAFMKKANRG